MLFRALLQLSRSFATQRQGPAVSKIGIPGVEHIIAVASGKGGVGKSTTAVNVAVALAKHSGLRVGLLDADVYGPSIPRLMALKGKPPVNEDKKMVPLENYGVRCMSMGFLMQDDAAAVWRGPMVMSALDTFMRGVAWGPLDVLVIDMPPGTGDAQLSITQRLRLAGAVIVSTPQDIALIDARRGATMFRKVAVPTLGIVENMSFYVCPGCGREEHIFGHGGAARTGRELNMELLGQGVLGSTTTCSLGSLRVIKELTAANNEVPLEIAVRETSDAGVPIVIAHPDSASAAVYRSIAERVAQKLADGVGAQMPPKIVME